MGSFRSHIWQFWTQIFRPKKTSFPATSPLAEAYKETRKESMADSDWHSWLLPCN